MAFRSKLARYNTICCEQVMPVPVIPVCAVSCCLPRPFCEYKPSPQLPQQSSQQATPIQIPAYCAGQPAPPTGTILTISSTVIPNGYLAADGSAVSRTTYAALFLVIGTQYGEGDGSTTFNLPNLSSGYSVSYIIKT
jgi:hypothetical protein